MSHRSPLRYPGGKTRGVKAIAAVIEQAYPGRRRLLSPFLGGASTELALAAAGWRVVANDAFAPLMAFWRELQANRAALIADIRRELPMDKQKFAAFRKNLAASATASATKVATEFFLVNRSSFSGATFCGGFSQQSADGRCGMRCLQPLETVCLENFEFHCGDFGDFLEAHPETPEAVLFCDPPYLLPTPALYGRDGDLHESFDHAALADRLLKRRDWVLCYNDCEPVRRLYAGCRFLPVAWSYGMNRSKKSNEVLILPGTSAEGGSRCCRDFSVDSSSGAESLR